MTRYEVVIPWFGVKVGQVIETDNLHSALEPNVRRLSNDEPEGELVPSTPTAKSGNRKEIIVARLKELGIEFDKRKSVDDLAALLPEGELDVLFPAE